MLNGYLAQRVYLAGNWFCKAAVQAALSHRLVCINAIAMLVVHPQRRQAWSLQWRARTVRGQCDLRMGILRGLRPSHNRPRICASTASPQQPSRSTPPAPQGPAFKLTDAQRVRSAFDPRQQPSSACKQPIFFARARLLLHRTPPSSSLHSPPQQQCVYRAV